MHIDSLHTLAASNSTGVLLWAGILIVVAMIGGFIITMVRRNMLGDHARDDAGSMMEQMRKMVERGQMTQEEFDLAKKTIIEKARAGIDRPAAPPPAHPAKPGPAPLPDTEKPDSGPTATSDGSA
ncbi:MAG: hypothetical protein AB8F26_04580 [Phycisphaerales bacterium]